MKKRKIYKKIKYSFISIILLLVLISKFTIIPYMQGRGLSGNDSHLLLYGTLILILFGTYRFFKIILN